MAVDPAASEISSPNGTLGTSLTLSLTRYNTSFTDTITYKCGNASGTVKSGSTAASVAWDTSNGNTVALAAQNTSGQSVEVTFTVTTYSGGTVVGTNTTKATLAIPNTVKPSVALTVTDAAGYLSTYGAYVQGYSKLKITATPTLAYGSPIKTYAITADGASYATTPVTTAALKGKGTLTVTAKVTDDRGYPSDTVSKSIAVLEYAKPVVNVSAYRCNSSGTADPEGAYMKIVVTSTISGLGGKNSATYKVVHPGGTLTGSGTSFTSAVLTCDVSSTQNIEVTITDKLSSTTKAVVVPIAYTLVDYYNTGRGVSFGKVGTRDGFDCAMPAYFSGSVEFGNGFTDGSDTGWQAINECISYRYKCGYVTVIGISNGEITLTSGDYKIIGKVPSQYAPKIRTPVVFHTVGGSPVAQSGYIEHVNAAGDIRLYSNVGGTSYWAFTVTYPL
jgi:hypothetical protein